MFKTKLMQSFTTFCLIYLFLSSPTAYAYLDPGTGSIILQGIIGAISAFVVLLRLYWHRLIQFLGLEPKKENEREPTQEDN